MSARAIRVFGVAVLVCSAPAAAGPPDDGQKWPDAVNGLQAKLTLVQAEPVNGTRQLVPYLELRNASDSAYPLKVRCGHAKFELLGLDGKPVRGGQSLPRDGHHPDPGTVALPFGSSMRLWMGCTNWGVPKDAAAMISTDSGAWVLKPAERGLVLLRVTIRGEPDKADPDRVWHGTVQATIPVEWKE
jgi:hypothetical protein